MALDEHGGVCTVRQASEMLGIKMTTLNGWDDTEFIRPSVLAYHGRRPIRFYTFMDLVALRVANQLREAGVTVQALRRIVKYLQADDNRHPLSTTMLVAIGDDVYEVKSDEELISVLRRPGQGAFRYVVDVAATAQEVESNLRELRAA